MGSEREIELRQREVATIKHRRSRALEQYKIIGWILLNCSLLSVIVGVVILVIGQNVDAFPIPTGSPIWSGLVVAVVCVLCFVVACYNPHFADEADSKKFQRLVLAYTISAFIAIGVCLISFGFTVYGTVRCATWRNEFGQLSLLCGSNYDIQIVMLVAASLLSIFIIIFLIYGIVLYFLFKDTYTFYEWERHYYYQYSYNIPEQPIRVENTRYVRTEREPIVENTRYVAERENVHYVSAENPRIIEDTNYTLGHRVIDDTNYTLGQDEHLKAADVVSEYRTDRHKYIVLRLNRDNKVKPI